MALLVEVMSNILCKKKISEINAQISEINVTSDSHKLVWNKVLKFLGFVLYFSLRKYGHRSYNSLFHCIPYLKI